MPKTPEVEVELVEDISLQNDLLRELESLFPPKKPINENRRIEPETQINPSQ